MTAELVAQGLKAGLLIWLVMLMLIIIVRIMRGEIRTSGVLANDRDRAGTETTAPRAISALVFPLVILFLLAEALNFDPSVLGPNGRPTFPDISDNLIMLLTGSNSLYLADKLNLFRNGVSR